MDKLHTETDLVARIDELESLTRIYNNQVKASVMLDLKERIEKLRLELSDLQQTIPDTLNSNLLLTIDNGQTPDCIMGKLVPEGINPNADIVYGLLKRGFVFQVAPELIVKKMSKDGVIEEAELICLSIVTSSIKKMEDTKQ